MATEQNDGAIIIDTKIDTEGLEAGSSELLNAIKSLSAQVEKLGEAIKTTFSGSGQAARTASTDMESYQATITALEEKVRSLEATIESLKASSNGAVVDFGTSKTKASSLQKEIESVARSVQKLGPTFENAMSGDAKSIELLETRIKSISDQIEALRTRLEQEGQIKVPTEDYAFLCKELEKANTELEKLLDRQARMRATGVSTSSRSWLNLQYDIEQVRRKLATYNAEKAQMESSGTSHVLVSETSAYSAMASTLDGATTALNNMDAALQRTKADMSSGGANGFSDTIRATIPLSERLRNIFTSILYPIRVANSLLGKMASALSQVGRTAISSIGGLVKKAFVSLGGAIKSATSRILLFRRNMDKTSKASTSFGRAINGISRMLRRMLFYRAFTATVDGIKTGMNNLAQYSSEVNKHLSTMKSMLTQLKNAFATAFAPVLSVVVPILAKLIGYLISALNVIGKFIAALTGAKTFTQAKAVQEDYAASLEETGSAAKEAKKQLAGFDELNILSDSSTDGSGGGSEISPSDMFEEVAIDSPILDFVERLKEAFRNGDYEEIGRILGEKINEAIYKLDEYINWDNVGGKITEIVTAFTTILNSLVATIDWEALGKLVGDGINTIVNTLYLLLTGIDWYLIGQSLADGLDSAIATVDWDKLGKTIGEYFNSKLHTALGFVQNFDWSAAGTALSEGLNGIVEAVDWKGIGTLLSDGVIGALDFIKSAISGFDWKKLGSSVADGINAIDWAGSFGSAAGALSEAVKGLLDLCIGFARDLDWGRLGTQLWDSIVAIVKNIDWTGIVKKAFELLGDVIGGASALFAGLCNAIFDSLERGLEETRSYFDAFIEEAGGNIILGLWNGIVNALKNVGSWIKKNIFNPFINGFKDAFGISSPSTVMEEMGGYLIAGLLNGITSAWRSITSFFSESLSSLIDSISDAWGDIKKKTSDAWDKVRSTVKDVWKNLTGDSSDGSSSIKKAVSDSWKDVKSATSEKWSSVKETVKSTWSSIKSNVTETGSAVKKNVSDTWTNVKENITSKLTAAKSSASSIWSSIKSTTTSMNSSIKSTVSSSWESIKSNVTSKLNSIKSTASSSWNSIKSTVTSSNNSMKSTLSSTWSSIYSTMSSKMSSIKTTMTNTFSSLQSSASTWGRHICENLASGISSFAYKVANAAKSVASSIKSFLGFSEPEAGPLRRFHTFMPDMLDLMAKGILDNEYKAADAAASVAQAISDEVQNGDYAVDCAVKTPEVDSAMTNFGDKITEGFTDLLHRLQAIAEGVTFAVPAAASGVVPYNVSASVGESKGVTGDAFAAYSEDMSSVVIQSVTNATSAIVKAIQEYSGTNVNIDADSLTNTIIAEINRRTRMTGKSPLLI